LKSLLFFLGFVGAGGRSSQPHGTEKMTGAQTLSVGYEVVRMLALSKQPAFD
jgi:hypothetical protein